MNFSLTPFTFSRSVCLLAAFFTITHAALAQFGGEFGLTGSTVSFNSAQSATVMGNWNVTLSGSGILSGTADTTNSPTSFSLSVTGAGQLLQGTSAGTSTMVYTHLAQNSEALSFNVQYTSALKYDVLVDGLHVAPLSDVSSVASYSFDLMSGSTLGLSVSATGANGTLFVVPIFMFLPGLSQTNTITVSNFQSVSAVPEPSTYAIGAGCVVLAFAFYRRGRRLLMT